MTATAEQTSTLSVIANRAELVECLGAAGIVVKTNEWADEGWELVSLSPDGEFIAKRLVHADAVDIRCAKCGKPHFEGDCTMDPTYHERHFTGIAPSINSAPSGRGER